MQKNVQQSTYITIDFDIKFRYKKILKNNIHKLLLTNKEGIKMSHYSRLISFFFLMLILVTPSFSKKEKSVDESKKEKELLTSSTISGLKLRLIGPGAISGRIVDIAVHPQNKSIWYVAVASGGVWKTTNAGITFEPIFDNEGSFSIGCVTIDPINPHIVWVGTGENNSQRSVAYGDGVYKSLDDGKSWTNMGLKSSEHIGKIVVDPRNSEVVYVAAQGPLWAAGGDRGLYKTTDGGKTWEQVLKIDEWTGVSDIAYDPRNPDVIYATSYQRARAVWTLVDGGPGSALHKTTDGGKTWNKLTNGLPGGDLGRIGVSVSPANPDYVYVLVEASGELGGLFRSTDRGASWEKRNPWKSVSAQYYQEIFCDPYNPDKIYLPDTYTMYSLDGGKTLQRVGLKYRHVDDHAFWIDKDMVDHFMIGGDGGLYETYDGGKNFRWFGHLPVGQFYRITADNSEPFYYVYGGTQDNNSWGGPSQTNNSGGILNDDWFQTIGGDGYQSRIDPIDPNIVYAEFQYGGLGRFDRRNGEMKFIQPQPKEGQMLRWNWDCPYIISPYDNKTLYMGANVLFKSTDRGDSWEQISPDLTRQVDRNKLKLMGKIWNADAIAKSASTSLYGNIVSLAESPKKQGLIFVGTDDGLIQVTNDDGKTWNKYEKINSLPELIYVSDICPSQFDENTVYVSYDNHKNGDFKPYIFKSIDQGKTWVSIASNLPERGTIYTVAEDFVDPNLLFVGTEFGLFFTNDGGQKWIQLKGGFPIINVRDLDIQKRENDLVVATFGRGIYILDNYAPLRDLNKDNLDKEAYIFPVKDAKMFIMDDSRAKDAYGSSFYRASNPPFGATFTYYLKEGYKTKKDLRIKVEKEADEKNEVASYPSLTELWKENLEERPQLIFNVYDSDKNLVRTLTAPATAGVNRINWDLRYPNTNPVAENTDPNHFSGFPVLPGKYSVTLSKNLDGNITQIAGPVEFEVKHLGHSSFPVQNRKDLVDFQKKVAKLQQAVTATNEYFNDIFKNVKLMNNAVQNSANVDLKLIEKIRTIQYKLEDLRVTLYGNSTIAEANENQTPSINDRLGYITWVVWDIDSAPTGTAEMSYDIISKELKQLISDLKKLVNNDILPIQNELQKIGAPWTPGREPIWE
jgi:photosystem II stability/assembly factor-like uncharacterized protein